MTSVMAQVCHRAETKKYIHHQKFPAEPQLSPWFSSADANTKFQEASIKCKSVLESEKNLIIPIK